MATTRLRRTFAYPDSDSNSDQDVLDEHEQEELIRRIVDADAQKTENYKKSFLVLPLLSIVPYLPSLTRSTLLTHLLAITSLLSSAYALWILPSKADASRSTKLPLGRHAGVEDGPLKKYIDNLNAGTCVLLALQALRAKRSGLIDEVWLAVLPTFVFLLLFLVRSQLHPVDVKALENLKYGYKGA
ncbi:uncharacterized protein PV09_03716 [Verruconis gallopava]|uniref:Uncharacterized protein n=1 Tax=Verruconis gallopava TaxID=253628 RepID=A0A0D2AFB0_9PEZI|nr:uncharacterized protein PV09_03716 [Verruconis gallopava]KIW05165.1 hypothetical protein PV09_03716 [Verruconis gallopava]